MLLQFCVEMGDSTNGKPFDAQVGRQQLSSVSTALVLAIGIGIFEALALSFGSGFLLNLMGISHVCSSPDIYWLFALWVHIGQALACAFVLFC